MFLCSYAYQDCIHLIKNTVKIVILWTSLHLFDQKYSKNSNIVAKAVLFDQKYGKNSNIMTKAAFILSEVQ